MTKACLHPTAKSNEAERGRCGWGGGPTNGIGGGSPPTAKKVVSVPQDNSDSDDEGRDNDGEGSSSDDLGNDDGEGSGSNDGDSEGSGSDDGEDKAMCIPFRTTPAGSSTPFVLERSMIPRPRWCFTP
jgi:hypothetical protein